MRDDAPDHVKAAAKRGDKSFLRACQRKSAEARRKNTEERELIADIRKQRWLEDMAQAAQERRDDLLDD